MKKAKKKGEINFKNFSLNPIEPKYYYFNLLSI